MKKIILLSLLFIISVFIFTGCVSNKKSVDENGSKESEMDNMDFKTNITITLDGKNYKATLEDNETARAFVGSLPQEFNMSELNGNEKYIYMDEVLPTNPSNPKRIEAGDIMLYGNDCLVIFYKSFDTSYSYTRIGHIDNLPDLGDDKVIAKFESN